MATWQSNPKIHQAKTCHFTKAGVPLTSVCGTIPQALGEKGKVDPDPPWELLVNYHAIKRRLLPNGMVGLCGQHACAELHSCTQADWAVCPHRIPAGQHTLSIHIWILAWLQDGQCQMAKVLLVLSASLCVASRLEKMGKQVPRASKHI